MLPEVEGLRFIAIFTVVFHHLIGNIISKNTHLVFKPIGRFGVMLFFSISGFILALRFAQQHLGSGSPVSLKAYLIRRLTRLEPPFLINAILLLPIALAIHGISLHSLFECLASASYTHQLIYRTDPIINGVTWSLELEIQFYLLAPLLALIYKLRPRAARYLILTIAIVVASFCNQNYGGMSWYRTSVLFFIQYFLVGFLLADIYVDLWKDSKEKTWGWDMASMVGWSIICILVYKTGQTGVDQITPVVLIGILLAYAGALRGRFSGFALSFGFIPIIGGMCYTIYLYHYWAIILTSHITARVMHGSSFLFIVIMQSIVSLSLIAAISIVMFALIERPCMDRHWPEKLIERLARWHSLKPDLTQKEMT